jgi:hypothetical protein
VVVMKSSMFCDTVRQARFSHFPTLHWVNLQPRWQGAVLAEHQVSWPPAEENLWFPLISQGQPGTKTLEVYSILCECSHVCLHWTDRLFN